jgi:hypothetical protein
MQNSEVETSGKAIASETNSIERRCISELEGSGFDS